MSKPTTISATVHVQEGCLIRPDLVHDCLHIGPLGRDTRLFLWTEEVARGIATAATAIADHIASERAGRGE